jgi:hypothetical protein
VLARKQACFLLLTFSAIVEFQQADAAAPASQPTFPLGQMPESNQVKPDVKWQDSRAKAKLKKDILSGKVLPEWKPMKVFAMRPELYKPYKKNFAANLRRLQKSLKEQQDRADEDDAAVRHDLGLYPRSVMDERGYPRWDESAAQQLLKQDVKEGRHVGIKKKAFQQTRPEYKVFPRKVFADHVKQEVNSRLAKSYWLNRSKSKKKERAEEEDDGNNSM